MFTLQFYLTAIVLVVAVLIIARMIIIEKRPRDDLNPRLIPTTPVLIASGFVPIRLGPRILRAETAALAALASFMAIAGDWRLSAYKSE